VPLAILKSTTEAVKRLRAGHLVIYPTETAYALGADATNQKATRKIFQVKSRNKSKSLSLIVASLAMAEKYAKFSSSAKQLAKKYWPGPLTIVVPAKTKSIAESVISKDKTVAIRVSSHPLARLLSQRLRHPLVATSANLSGHSNIYSARSLKKSFAGAPETIYLLFGGTLPRRRPSTIVVLKNGKLIVLRQGSIKVKGIRN